MYSFFNINRHFQVIGTSCIRPSGTVNSPYSGHPRDRNLVSVIARVRNSGMQENFYFKPYLQKGVFTNSHDHDI